MKSCEKYKQRLIKKDKIKKAYQIKTKQKREGIKSDFSLPFLQYLGLKLRKMAKK